MEDGLVGLLLGVVVGALLAVCGTMVYHDHTYKVWQQEAASHGYGEYKFNPQTGEAKFQWGGKPIAPECSCLPAPTKQRRE
jgi:hypothetical protein